MASETAHRRLIVTADDFGRSAQVNRAVLDAHLHGILTCASLMVNESAADEAIRIALAHPHLGVGLHLVLCDGRACLPPSKIPGLVRNTDRFMSKPVLAGIRYYFDHRLRNQLRAEIRAQIEKFRSSGLVMDHITGHLNIHMHPVVLDILLDLHRTEKLPPVRLTYDPLWLNLRLDRRRPGYKLTHFVVFHLLSGHARRRCSASGVKYADRVFGLLQTHHLNECFLLGLLRRLPPGTSELYAHPGARTPDTETAALTSPEVKQLLHDNGIALVRYQDL